MRPGPARITGGNRQDGTPAVPAAGSRGRAGKFVLAAAAGLALASGAVTGTPAAHATAAVSARAAAAVRANPIVEPCPCINPLCRPGCSQSVASGGPAAMIHQQARQGARQATAMSASAAIICPPPSGDGVTSKTGDPGC